MKKHASSCQRLIFYLLDLFFRSSVKSLVALLILALKCLLVLKWFKSQRNIQGGFHWPFSSLAAQQRGLSRRARPSTHPHCQRSLLGGKFRGYVLVTIQAVVHFLRLRYNFTWRGYCCEFDWPGAWLLSSWTKLPPQSQAWTSRSGSRAFWSGKPGWRSSKYTSSRRLRQARELQQRLTLL